MKTYYGNYLGMVIENNDPEYRGRIQVFVPHIMPTLYEGWNEKGDNISIDCVGDNMEKGLGSEIVKKLKKILPWAEAASPIVGQGIAGGVVPAFNGTGSQPSGAPDATATPVDQDGKPTQNVLDQSPTAAPAGKLPPGTKLIIPKANGGVDYNGMASQYVQRLNGFYTEATSLGYKILCTSGNRTYAKQKQLWDENVRQYPPNGNGYVSKPGGSCHEFGIAVDLYVSGNGVSITQISAKAEKARLNRDTPAYKALLKKWGLHQPMLPDYGPEPWEHWHIEPIETPIGGRGYRVGNPQYAGWQKKTFNALNTTSTSIGETTSSSQFPAIANTLEHKALATTDISHPQSPKTGLTPTKPISNPTVATSATTSNLQSATVNSGPTTGATAATTIPPAAAIPSAQDIQAANNQLAKDRTAYFRPELSDPQLLDRIEYLFFHQEYVGKDPACGSLIFETAVNRAFFFKTSLKKLIFTAAYYAHNGMSTRPHTNLALEVIKRVIYNGQNHTNMATDNASNTTKDPVAWNRIRYGCTGSWFDLTKGGKQVTDPSRIATLAKTPASCCEFLYIADGTNGYSSDAGLRAKAYAKKYNIQATSPSTFNANTPLPKDLADVRSSVLTGKEVGAMPEAASVNNTDGHGATIIKNTNDSAKGLFAFPGVGSMVWVFFREGNPLFPVYFAASYSSTEWKSAYGGSSLNAEGTNNGTTGTQVANSMKLNPNAGGGLEFTHIKDASDPSGAADKSVAMIYGDDGSNMVFSKGYHQIYTRHDRRDQIDGHLYSTLHGAEERWVEEDSNTNIRGNVFIRIGKVDNESMEAMKELADFSTTLNETLMTNSGQ